MYTSYMKVLFIEDDPQQMDIFKIYFERNGIEVERSYDGPDGVKVAENWKPDFIVLDIRMEGMDGLEVMRVLQKSEVTKNIPVIAYTNYDPKLIVDELLNLGGIVVWEKTVVRPPELVEQIKKMFDIINNHDSVGDTFPVLRDKLRLVVD